ncbi:hypothetical protein AALB39_25655 [Lachnospiraceae bacterium 54-53]
MTGSDRRQLNRKQLKACLKSAVSDLTPSVLERIDLSTPQEKEETVKSVFAIRRRVIATLTAACLCMIALAGGTYTYQNGKVDSVIGIDVNPSVELSVNRKNKVLSAEALNGDAKAIMKDMDLKGVDLNVAVNAVIGSMVTNGFLDNLDNAILVTVSNDSISKASSLRSAVVSDIRNTLEEKQLKAVVYDQQVIEEDEVKELADEYDISYGKAFFLKELITQNASLTMEDMKELAPLTMEEIARVITERSYAVGGRTGVTEETTENHTTQPASTAQSRTAQQPSSEESTAETPPVTESQTAAQTTPAQTQPTATAPAATEATSSDQEPVSKENIKIDYVDYENGVVTVHFKTKVKWKNPTVSIKDEDGNTYSAKVEDTGSESCEISVTGLKGAMEYTFVLGGISPKIGKQTTVSGIFETPVIGDGNADPEDDEEESEETQETEQTATSGETPSESVTDEQETETSGEETQAPTTAGQEEPTTKGSSS